MTFQTKLILLSDHKLIGHHLPLMTFLLPPVMRRHSAGVYSVLGLAVLASVLAWHCQRLPLHFLLYYLAPVLVWARLILYLITRSFTGLAVSRLGALVILQVVAILLIIRESFFDRRWLSLGFLTLLTRGGAARGRAAPCPRARMPIALG